MKVDGDPKSRITISGNELQFVGTQMRFVDTAYTAAGAVDSYIRAGFGKP